MEHLVIYVCTEMRLQTVLCYAYMISITNFKIKRNVYIASRPALPPPLRQRKILGAHLPYT